MRSSSSSTVPATSGGNANRIMSEATNDAHTKTGMRLIDIPGARKRATSATTSMAATNPSLAPSLAHTHTHGDPHHHRAPSLPRSVRPFISRRETDPDLAMDPERTIEDLRAFMSQDHPFMPFDQLDAQDREDILAYMMWLRPRP